MLIVTSSVDHMACPIPTHAAATDVTGSFPGSRFCVSSGTLSVHGLTEKAALLGIARAKTQTGFSASDSRRIRRIWSRTATDADVEGACDDAHESRRIQSGVELTLSIALTDVWRR
jgi:hypothetical protein